MKTYAVTELRATVPVPEFTEQCVDVEKFLGFCRQCPNFGKIWACPPLSVDPMEIWRSYDRLELYARVLTAGEGTALPDFLQGFRQEKILLSRQVLELEKKIPGSLSMAASTCIQCSPCLRTLGKPCCHPEQLRCSIEALGGDVGRTMEKYLGKPLQWIEQGKLPAYLTVVAGLLCRNPREGEKE